MPVVSARFGLPIDGPPLEPCRVQFEGDTITAVDDQVGQADLEEAVILPGFVNPHTHLEFSSLTRPLGRPGMRFADWVRGLVEARASGSLTPGGADAIAMGIRESSGLGVHVLGEIATSDDVQPFAAAPRMAGVVFRELLGLARHRTKALLQTAADFLKRFPVHRWRGGLSPHAPYTIGPACLERIVALAKAEAAPMAMHLAETTEELELLAAHRGPLFELLQELDAWDASALPRGTSPLDYLRILSQAERCLVVHGNYLESDAFNLLARHRDRMALVYCPRTHAFFDHRPYPLAELLDNRLTVTIGTDSRASNPDLDILAELQWLARQHEELPASRIVPLATLAAARAMNISDSCGSLTPGKRADLTIVDLSETSGSSVCERLLRGPTRVLRCYHGGRLTLTGGSS